MVWCRVGGTGGQRQIDEYKPDLGLENLYYNCAPSRPDNKDMECGGMAKRRHRFPRPGLIPKAAWRFASRRTPNPVAAAKAALGLFVYVCGFPLHGHGFASEMRETATMPPIWIAQCK